MHPLKIILPLILLVLIFMSVRSYTQIERFEQSNQYYGTITEKGRNHSFEVQFGSQYGDALETVEDVPMQLYSSATVGQKGYFRLNHEPGSEPIHAYHLLHVLYSMLIVFTVMGIILFGIWLYE